MRSPFSTLWASAGVAALALNAWLPSPAAAHEGHEGHDPHGALHQELGNQHDWEHQYLGEVEARWREYHPYASARQYRQFRAHLARAHAHNHRALARAHSGWHQDPSGRGRYRDRPY